LLSTPFHAHRTLQSSPLLPSALFMAASSACPGPQAKGQHASVSFSFREAEAQWCEDCGLELWYG